MAKKAKKRGVKPESKRGPYKCTNKPISLADYSKQILEPSIAKFKAAHPEFVGNLPSLISDLTSTIDTLEAQLTAQIDRIKSILQ